MLPTLILTRPKAQSEGFAAEVMASWDGPLQIIQSPLIEIVPLEVQPTPTDAVIFTSANGVASAARLNLTVGLTAWCVGSKTAALAKAAGFAPIEGPGDANGLIATIIASHPSGRIVHIRGKHARGDVSKRLNAAGIACMDLVTYDQRERPLSVQAHETISAANFVIFPLFSPRTATILAKQEPISSDVVIIALSEAVRDALPVGFARQVITAEKPDQAAMLEATLALLHQRIGRS